MPRKPTLDSGLNGALGIDYSRAMDDSPIHRGVVFLGRLVVRRMKRLLDESKASGRSAQKR